MKDIIKKDWKFFCVLTISMLALLLMCFYSLKVSDKTYHKSEDIRNKKSKREVSQDQLSEV